MVPWYVQVLLALAMKGVTTVGEIIALGKAGGMTDEEAAKITAGYDAMIARREAAAKGDG